MTQAQDTALLDAVFDAAVDAMVVADSHGFIIRVNVAATQLFGYDTADLLGRNVSLLMPPSVAGAHDGYMHHHLATGDQRIIGTGRAVEGLRFDGKVFPLHISVGRANHDGTAAFIAIMHDLTARRATQQALSRSQRLDAIGQMTGGIAHDFNNLLTVVIGNLELVGNQQIDANTRDMITDALEAAELGADLTARLTQFARQGSLKPELTDINAACHSAMAMLHRTIGANYRIVCNPDPDMVDVVVDPTQLQTAVMNLALNARDAMPDGGQITITSKVVLVDDSYVAQEIDVNQGTYARISVTDTGTGMSTEAQLRAFEPFFTTKPMGKGTGLGLSMVHGFARQSNGHVTLYSEPGQGSTISIYIPVKSDAMAPYLDRTGAQTLPGHNQRVLVVEDNAKVRSLSCERLAALGYHPLSAATGDAAFEMLQAGLAVDVLFTDLVMPGTLGGLDLAERVKAAYPDIKIILTTGYAKEALERNNALANPFVVLSKPYRQGDLARVLQNALSDQASD